MSITLFLQYFQVPIVGYSEIDPILVYQIHDISIYSLLSLINRKEYRKMDIYIKINTDSYFNLYSLKKKITELIKNKTSHLNLLDYRIINDLIYISFFNGSFFMEKLTCFACTPELIMSGYIQLLHTKPIYIIDNHCNVNYNQLYLFLKINKDANTKYSSKVMYYIPKHIYKFYLLKSIRGINTFIKYKNSHNYNCSGLASPDIDGLMKYIRDLELI
jgi:hypothetical protein